MSAGLDVERVLAEHVRYYQLCECGWTCDGHAWPADHRAHVAAKVREAVAAWLESEAAVETAAVAINRADNEALEATNFGTVVATYRDEAAAALSALTEAVRDA